MIHGSNPVSDIIREAAREMTMEEMTMEEVIMEALLVQKTKKNLMEEH